MSRSANRARRRREDQRRETINPEALRQAAIGGQILGQRQQPQELRIRDHYVAGPMKQPRTLQKAHGDGTVESFVIGGETTLEGASIRILAALLQGSPALSSTIASRATETEARTTESISADVASYRALALEAVTIARICLQEARIEDPTLPGVDRRPPEPDEEEISEALQGWIEKIDACKTSEEVKSIVADALYGAADALSAEDRESLKEYAAGAFGHLSEEVTLGRPEEIENWPVKSKKVFSRPECLFNYCPTEERCREECQTPREGDPATITNLEEPPADE